MDCCSFFREAQRELPWAAAASLGRHRERATMDCCSFFREAQREFHGLLQLLLGGPGESDHGLLQLLLGGTERESDHGLLQLL